MKSRQWPKITLHGENHGNHSDRELVIFLQPYQWCHQIIIFC